MESHVKQIFVTVAAAYANGRKGRSTVVSLCSVSWGICAQEAGTIALHVQEIRRSVEKYIEHCGQVSYDGKNSWGAIGESIMARSAELHGETKRTLCGSGELREVVVSVMDDCRELGSNLER